MVFFNFLPCFFTILFYFNLKICSSLFLLHFALSPPLFIYDINFLFFLSLVSIPYSYYFSSLYPLKIIFLSVGHLISTLLSYDSLNLCTSLLIFTKLLLIVWSWVGVTFAGVCFVSWVLFFCSGSTCTTAYKTGRELWLSASQPEGRTHQKQPNRNQNTITTKEPI